VRVCGGVSAGMVHFETTRTVSSALIPVSVDVQNLT